MIGSKACSLLRTFGENSVVLCEGKKKVIRVFPAFLIFISRREWKNQTFSRSPTPLQFGRALVCI